MEVQIRYRTVWVISPAGIPVPTQVPYEYKIFHTKLENRGLEVVIREELTEDQWQRYQIFQDTLGGRPYLFNGGLPPGGSDGSGAPGIDYTVSAEALTDSEFASIYEEAKKYVGTPYVWAAVLPKLALTVPDTSAGSITRTVMTWGVLRPTDYGRKASIFPKQKQNQEIWFSSKEPMIRRG